MPKKPICLIILDGWGEREETAHNPTKTVATPTMDALLRDYPHMSLEASGEAVGLPAGQMGNSEVGHLHIGAGRKVPQDLTRIDMAINDGSFFKNEVLLNALKTAQKNNSAVHVLGLVSPGGVHSRDDQIAAMIKMIGGLGIKQNYLHAFLDGRDTPPQSALNSLKKIDALYRELPGGKIASLIGRYYAMDRDKRWDRTKIAYDLLTTGKYIYHASSAEAGLLNSYQQGENDEFVKPTSIFGDNEKPIIIEDNDVVIFMNFRADRARQLSFALTDANFTGFIREKWPKLADFVTLTEYADNLNAHIAFGPLELTNTLGEFLATHQLTQLRIAETEKYAHVTYFMDGGKDIVFDGEERILIPSPKVATYDLAPEMSAYELTTKLIHAIESQRFDVIICNYANPDMVGHTGIEDAANRAVAVIDECLARVISALKKVGGEALITADHGNIECMYDDEHHQPHTAHTQNLVPLIYVGRPLHFTEKQGCLDDIAPTLIALLGLKPPAEMTGKTLLKS